MWGMDRFTRPAWAVGLLISVGCVSSMMAGILVYLQSKKINKIEGIPVEDDEEEEEEEAEEGPPNPNGDNDIENGPDEGRPPKPERNTLLKKTRRRRGSEWFRRH